MTHRALTLTLAFSAMVSPALAAGVGFNLFAGVDLDSSVDMGSVTTDVANGYNLGLEVVVDVPVVEVGGGLEHGFPRDLTWVEHGDYQYVFGYGVARLGVLPFLYAVGRLGYAAVSAIDLLGDNVSGSLTWSLGAGVKVVDWFKAEALYTQFTGDLDSDGVSVRAVVTF